MKKSIVFSSLVLGAMLNAQVRNNSIPANAAANGTTAFLDASSSISWNGTNNQGKGLVFPRTDLTAMTSLLAPVNGIPASFPTRLDGMIVYNTGSGATKTGATSVNVTPGFYYYENKSNTLNGGTWKPLGSGVSAPTRDFTHGTPIDTGVTIASKKVFAVTGTFTHAGGITHDLDMPAGFDKMMQIKIYRISGTDASVKNLVGTTLYSYEVVGGKIRVNFGQGGILSTSYPEGTYEYILEYTKS